MSKKFLCVMDGYDKITEKNLASIQNELYNVGFVGTQTKSLPKHITLGTLLLEKKLRLRL
jgi:hypothetical protein